MNEAKNACAAVGYGIVAATDMSAVGSTNIWTNISRYCIVILIILGIPLLITTAQIQLSCYPMVAGGSLPKFCNNQVTKFKIIEDPRTHESTLDKFAADFRESSDTLKRIHKTSNRPVEDNPLLRTYLLASNPKVPESVLLDLAGTSDAEVIKRLLSNPSAIDNSKVKQKLCNNSLIKQKINCNAPPPPSCLNKHARNIMIGVGVGLLALIAAPILLPSSLLIGGTVVTSSTAGLIGGATASAASTGLLEFLTKC